MISATRECEARSGAWVLWKWRDEAGGVLCTPDWLFSGDVRNHEHGRQLSHAKLPECE
ncbi:hypothetical protein [Porcincola intestinalis]|uniref:hypothetical protein n=1 Tax=Porcincola intestinalis TaxID=2606632 RepID=UPI002A908994|nr:hypothetical protein [Porcincola intestinalis]